MANAASSLLSRIGWDGRPFRGMRFTYTLSLTRQSLALSRNGRDLQFKFSHRHFPRSRQKGATTFTSYLSNVHGFVRNTP